MGEGERTCRDISGLQSEQSYTLLVAATETRPANAKGLHRHKAVVLTRGASAHSKPTVAGRFAVSYSLHLGRESGYRSRGYSIKPTFSFVFYFPLLFASNFVQRQTGEELRGAQEIAPFFVYRLQLRQRRDGWPRNAEPLTWPRCTSHNPCAADNVAAHVTNKCAWEVFVL